jgi:hypothetical protein
MCIVRPNLLPDGQHDRFENDGELLANLREAIAVPLTLSASRRSLDLVCA